jgi:hypothetical protein
MFVIEEGEIFTIRIKITVDMTRKLHDTQTVEKSWNTDCEITTAEVTHTFVTAYGRLERPGVT